MLKREKLVADSRNGHCALSMISPRTLILMRHATAGGGHSDAARPLTADGVADAAAAGQWIRESLPPVDVTLCSTAVRTRQTLAATGIQTPASYLDELYGAGVDDILAALQDVPEHVRTVLVVAHAPGVPATAAELATMAALDRDDGGQPDLDALRYFSACTLAVLTTDAPWSELSERGADLMVVRHPED